MYKNKKKASSNGPTTEPNMDFDFKKIMKEVEFLGTSRMTWKEKQELENRKIVAMGGKPPKKQRVPLSVARVQMKKQKEREQKMLQKNLMHSRLGGPVSSSSHSAVTADKRRTKERTLKCSEGYFKNGILNVNHLLKKTPSIGSNDDASTLFGGHGKKRKGGGKKNGGKKKGKGRH